MNDNSVGYIYIITNSITGKCYVGYSSDPERRFKGHYWQRNRPGILNRAMRKYPRDSFSLQVIYCSKDKDYCCNVMEGHFIQEFGTHESCGGYNISRGGCGGPLHKYRKKDGCTAWNKGLKSVQVAWNKGLKLKPLSVDLRAKLSKANTGLRHSKEWIERFKYTVAAKKKLALLDSASAVPKEFSSGLST